MSGNKSQGKRKSQSEETVEFAFRDTSKPMGVATYNMAKELPPEYQGILPDAEKLKEVLGYELA